MSAAVFELCYLLQASAGSQNITRTLLAQRLPSTDHLLLTDQRTGATRPTPHLLPVHRDYFSFTELTVPAFHRPVAPPGLVAPPGPPAYKHHILFQPLVLPARPPSQTTAYQDAPCKTYSLHTRQLNIANVAHLVSHIAHFSYHCTLVYLHHLPSSVHCAFYC